MRLICPNCDAQYEVGDGVIPPEGRDVQCSNCGHTWFRMPDVADARPDEAVAMPSRHVAQPRSRGMRQSSRIQEGASDDQDHADALAEALSDADPADSAEQTDDAPTKGDGSETVTASETLTDNPPTDPAAEFFQGGSTTQSEDLYEEDQELPDTEEDDAFEASLRAALGDDGLPPETLRDEDEDEDEYGSDLDNPEDPAGTSLPAGGPLASRQHIPRRPLDPEVAEVLREEARREAEARRNESARGLESQPDLGLDSASVWQAAEARTQPTGWQEGDDPEMPAPGHRASGTSVHGHDRAIPGDPIEDGEHRSELFPDIEEVNSSLTATTDRGTDPDAPVTEEDAAAENNRTGFRLGFLLMVLLVTAGVALYRFAPQVIDRVPEAQPMLDRYVEAIDVARLRLDDWARVMVEKIGTLTN